MSVAVVRRLDRKFLTDFPPKAASHPIGLHSPLLSSPLLSPRMRTHVHTRFGFLHPIGLSPRDSPPPARAEWHHFTGATRARARTDGLLWHLDRIEQMAVRLTGYHIKCFTGVSPDNGKELTLADSIESELKA